MWVTGVYDPATNLTFWGTGNPGPWMGDKRPGDNLYTTSVMALDAASGKIKGHLQSHQNNSWDWDEVSPPIIVDYMHNGRTVKGLVDVARDGYLWMLERTADKINFVAGQPFVYHNIFTGLDPKTGHPIVAAEHKPGTGKKADFCPGLWGGKDWPPVAYSPKTKLLYIPANDNLCGASSSAVDINYVAGQAYTGVTSWMYLRKGADHIGEVQAWDLDSGKKVWTTNFGMSQNWGPMLATGGDVLFSGGTNDRKFRALDAKSGKVLWETAMPSGVNGVPMSFQVDGKQYIAVQSGWGVDAARMQWRLNLVRPGPIRKCRRAARSGCSRSTRSLANGCALDRGRAARRILSGLLQRIVPCLCGAMRMTLMAGLIALATATVPACGAAVAQDFRSGLSAYNSGDYARAFHDWLGLAEQGDPAAEAGIGFLFHKGLGVTQDDAEAATWFVKAAEQGQAEAQLLLGTLFFFGKGVPQSYVSAFAWCDIAETNGQSDASECRDVALEHMTPDETAQSFKIVTDWLGRHPRPSR